MDKSTACREKKGEKNISWGTTVTQRQKKSQSTINKSTVQGSQSLFVFVSSR